MVQIHVVHPVSLVLLSSIWANSRCAQEQYADMVQKKGIYLGILDLAILCLKRHKDVFMMFYDADFATRPGMKSLLEILQMYVSTDVGWNGCTHPDLASPNTWVIAASRADFQTDTVNRLNHYQPAFPQQGMHPDAWNFVTSEARNRLDKGIVRALKREEEASSDEEWYQSLCDHTQTLKAKAEFFRRLHAAGVNPVDVPSDGDCALWTILALEHGPMVRGEKSQHEQVKRLREDACH